MQMRCDRQTKCPRWSVGGGFFGGGFDTGVGMMRVKAAVPPQSQRTAKPTAYGHFDGICLGPVNGTALKKRCCGGDYHAVLGSFTVLEVVT